MARKKTKKKPIPMADKKNVIIDAKNIQLNKTQTAQVMRVSVRAFSEWAVEPCRREKTQVFYNLADVIEYKQKHGDTRSGRQSETRDELDLLKTEKARLEIEQLKGKFVSIEKVKREARAVGLYLKEQFKKIPLRLASRFAAESDPAKIEKLLSRDLGNVLSQIDRAEQVFDE